MVFLFLCFRENARKANSARRKTKDSADRRLNKIGAGASSPGEKSPFMIQRLDSLLKLLLILERIEWSLDSCVLLSIHRFATLPFPLIYSFLKRFNLIPY